MTEESFSIKKYLRDVPLPFCPGCGAVTVMSEFLKAVHEIGHRNLDKFVFCSGIGCSAWIPSPHFKADSVHTLHGRSIPVATGIKLIRPDVNVVVFGGDGDIVGIGLSHFIHAARRNLDIFVIMVNNMIYGMTGGQVAPTTPFKSKTTTTPYGSFEYPLDAARLAATAGAAYVARWTTAQATELRNSMKKALELEGFRFIEAVSQCPTAFGRRAGFKNAGEMVRWFRDNAISLKEAEKLAEDELAGKIVTGEFVQRQRLTLNKFVYRMIEEARKKVEEI
ncbi:2-oxoacid:ferredoxin oxidoreductase subunit beta [Candidatus Bathyarchaeota archaeon]|nr:2-oxoacid:ferredoxin oxidoreductase subunit beta [Candidatus Bathyarchaeota archaeon]